MSDKLTFEQIWALRVEAEASRRLARSLADDQAVLDLEGYASELEAEAARLQMEQELASRSKRRKWTLYARLMRPTYAGHA